LEQSFQGEKDVLRVDKKESPLPFGVPLGTLNDFLVATISPGNNVESRLTRPSFIMWRSDGDWSWSNVVSTKKMRDHMRNKIGHCQAGKEHQSAKIE
jgi:hypothetical protein